MQTIGHLGQQCSARDKSVKGERQDLTPLFTSDGALDAVAGYAVYSATRYIVKAQQISEMKKALNQRLTFTNSDWYGSYENDANTAGAPGGYYANRDNVLKGFAIMSLDPEGREIINRMLASDKTIFIVSGSDHPFTGTSGLAIFWNGNEWNGQPLDVVAFHESGHTVFGGALSGYYRRDSLGAPRKRGTDQ